MLLPGDVHYNTAIHRWSRPGRFGTPWHSELHLSQYLPDGRMYWIGTQVLVLGTMYDVKDDARRIVRRGMKDVLDWLGEPLDVYPTSKEVLDALKQGDAEFEQKRKEQGLA